MKTAYPIIAADGHVLEKDSELHRDIPEFLARADLSDEEKRLILYENPQKFYGLEI